MDAPLLIEREIELDLPVDELWELIGSAEGWRQWLVDEAALTLLSGETGEVCDDGVRRAVRVAHVDEGRSITFHWSEVDRPDDLSVVTLRIVEDVRGPRLHISEQWLAPVACADCPLRSGARWDLRACLLCIRASTACPV
jgi:uncharacterized protein YndB with AHSA1/START domain